MTLKSSNSSVRLQNNLLSFNHTNSLQNFNVFSKTKPNINKLQMIFLIEQTEDVLLEISSQSIEPNINIKLCYSSSKTFPIFSKIFIYKYKELLCNYNFLNYYRKGKKMAKRYQRITIQMRKDLLTEWEKNGRKGCATIAKKLGMKPQTAKKIIKDYRRNHIIRTHQDESQMFSGLGIQNTRQLPSQFLGEISEIIKNNQDTVVKAQPQESSSPQIQASIQNQPFYEPNAPDYVAVRNDQAENLYVEPQHVQEDIFNPQIYWVPYYLYGPGYLVLLWTPYEMKWLFYPFHFNQ